MEADERPAKIRKTDHAASTNSVEGSQLGETSKATAEELQNPKHVSSISVDTEGPFMSGAIQDTTLDVANELTEGRPDDDLPGPDSTAPPMSKNQLKKWRRRQEWEAQKESRKEFRKEKNKARRKRRREEKRNLPYEESDDQSNGKDAKSSKNSTSKERRSFNPVQLPVTFIFDCSWDDLMMDKEIVSLTSQLTRCYSDNHKSRFRSHMVVSSFEKRAKERFEKVLRRMHENWKGVRFRENNFVAVAEEAKQWMAPENHGGQLHAQFEGIEPEKALQEAEIIYLSSDSDVTLTSLKPYSTYIIGGLVDKNRHKGVCYKKACDAGVKTAKLPIGEYMQMVSRKILTVNQVNEIMLKWLEHGDWATAFDEVIPKRKGGVLKGHEDIDAREELEAEHDMDSESGLDSQSAGQVESPKLT